MTRLTEGQSGVRTVHIIIATCVWLLVTASASADTLRVVADRALIWNRPSGVSVVITQVNRGERLEVVRHIDEWYEVVLPRSGGGTQRTGFVRASQVELIEVSPRAGTSQAPPQRPQVRPGARVHRSFLDLNLTYRLDNDALISTIPAFAARYAEAGSISADYGTGRGLQFDIMGGHRFARQIGVGVGVSFYLRPDPVVVEARVPHPFYFNAPRPVSFEDDAVKGREVGVHIPVLWMPQWTGRMALRIFGGPSFFRATQDVITDVTVSESYPFDTAAITDTVSDRRQAIAAGFHAGADVSYFFNSIAGVGIGGRYSRATLTFDEDDDELSLSGRAGGGQVSAGLRFKF